MYSDLTRFADASFAQLVNTAFKQCHSTLMLSRSPLAASPLVTPALVLDELSPTADERGHALRLVLQWAVGELAPAPATFPFAVERPFDDPTWSDPRWWRYTLLRHRYLEPLHPDEFVEGGRFIETLLALTGIPGEDALFDERNRAIREVAQRLQRQLKDGAAAGELERTALADLTRPLARRPASLALLGIASIFDEVFPRAALLELAGREAVGQDLAALDWLVDQRYLRASDDGAELWISPRLREHMYRRQSRTTLQLRHERAHRRFLQAGEILAAAHHGLRAERWDAVAALALVEAPGLLADLQAAPLREIIDQLPAAKLSVPQQYAIQLLRADLAAQSGDAEVAIAACRTALRSAPGALEQARVYRRMGKLHEGRNQLAALGYYQQAVERFPTSPTNDPELIELLKDRGWLHILRKEWAAAEADLQRGLALAVSSPAAIRANLLDALAHWAMQQRAMASAIGYAQKALTLREEAGDLLGVAKSSGNLGLLYSAIGDYPGAVAAYQEAMSTGRRLGNRELVATALLNLGLAYHLQNLLDDAVAIYQECLGEARAVELHVIEVKALSNLAEALADLARLEEALRCWSAGLAAARRHHFDDQVAYFQELAGRYPTLGALPVSPPTQSGAPRPAPTASPSPLAVERTNFTHDEAQILALAAGRGAITPRLVMEALAVSKPTATRRLTALAARGHLQVAGQGRSTHYLLPGATTGLPQRLRDDRLRSRRDQWLHQFGAERIGRVGHSSRDGARWVVRFRTMPDLPAFFALEQEIQTLSEEPGRLMPEPLLEAGLTVDWVW